MEWNKFIFAVLSRTNLACGKGQWSLLLILPASLKGHGMPTHKFIQGRDVLWNSSLRAGEVTGLCPSPLKPGGTPTISQELAGQRGPPGRWEGGRWLHHLATFKPRACLRWPSCYLATFQDGRAGWVCFSLELIVFHSLVEAALVPWEGGGRVGWPWALGPSAPSVGLAAGFPGKQTCWGLCTRQALGHDSQPPRDGALLAPGANVARSPVPAALRRAWFPQLDRQEKERKDKMSRSQGAGGFPWKWFDGIKLLLLFIPANQPLIRNSSPTVVLEVWWQPRWVWGGVAVHESRAAAIHPVLWAQHSHLPSACLHLALLTFGLDSCARWRWTCTLQNV